MALKDGVHRPDKAGKRGEQTGGQASSEAGGFLREVEGEIRNRATVAVAIPEEEGLHEGDVFAPVVRSQVRFPDRFGSQLNSLYLLCLRRLGGEWGAGPMSDIKAGWRGGSLRGMESGWSGRRDSNSRPLAPKASALPGCATPRHPCSLALRYGDRPGV